jgi:hypothetical protein
VLEVCVALAGDGVAERVAVVEGKGVAIGVREGVADGVGEGEGSCTGV